ncbi:hypothetical protein Daus18300_000299 [Diaporthe australafricana]|uniref:Uncharacterized protein n=1 Tax=Diaporthe australafricana TaxID=127596 RepID=A0ABR3Y5M8_9PEZI
MVYHILERVAKTYDLLAEYHLPRSGIEYVVDKMPFPACGNPPDPIMLHWLANLSSRRMLNRVHHIVYDQAAAAGVDGEADVAGTSQRARPASVASTLQLSSEFRHQLRTWYDSIPAPIKPDLDRDSPTADEVILILRYHATGDIIFRPFLLQVCSLASPASVTQSVLENAVACLEHCTEFLRKVGYRTNSPSSSTEITLHS